jgi:hypothetical protein
VRLRLGDLLLKAKLVTAEQLAAALELQTARGGRLGDHLVSTGALTQAGLDAFLHRMPAEPADLAATRIEVNDLLGLLMKVIFDGRLETVRQFVEAIKLPSHIVLELVRVGVDRKLLYSRATGSFNNSLDVAYAFTDEGRRWTLDALEQSRYAGPAPVTLEEFTDQVNLQKITNEIVTVERIRGAIGDLTFDGTILEQCGPALNSGRAILLYGTTGNGKTSVALRLANIFNDVIYVPYSIIIDGQIIAIHDPMIHTPLSVAAPVLVGKPSVLVRREEYDPRWVPCRRPFVIAGGELTMEMLDLRFDETSNLYDAPLHMKVLGGCFVIDDFGRQLVSPTKLLNRWIVPLESRVDYHKLRSGKSFSIPFDELVIFSTNLEPEDLMDPAFLRRLPYKIEIGSPTLELFQQIFLRECEPHGLILTPEIFERIVTKITVDKALTLAGYQPRFIIDQVIATCRFLGQPPSFEPRFIDFAIDNLRVKRSSKPKSDQPATA